MKIKISVFLLCIILIIGWAFISMAQSPIILPFEVKLNDLADVSVKSPDDEDLLSWDSTTRKWISWPLTLDESEIDHNQLLNYEVSEHKSLPGIISEVLSDHSLAAHTALGLFDQSSDVDHDSTTNYSAVQHIDWTAASQDFSTTGSATIGSSLELTSGDFNIDTSGSNNPLNLMKDASAGIDLFIDSDGVNRDLDIFGYITAGAQVYYGKLTMDDTNDEFEIWAENDANVEGVTILIRQADQMFRIRGSGRALRFAVAEDGGIHAASMKSGTTQSAAGAAAGELWVDTDNNRVKRGT